MNVAFPFTDPLPQSVALKMIESVRRHIPDAYVIQMTDNHHSFLPGVDSVQCKPRGSDFIPFRFTHLAQLPREDTILLDYDVIVQGDLAHVFHDPFDLALTRRDQFDKSITPKMLHTLPHNAGVMFSRAAGFDFWLDALTCYRSGTNQNGWLDGALAVEIALRRTQLSIREYPCAIYNYTPSQPNEDLTGRLAVHFKGNRKFWIGGEEARAAGQAVAFDTLTKGFMRENA